MGQNDDGEMLVKMNDIAQKYQTLLFSDTLNTKYLKSYQAAEYNPPGSVKTAYQDKERKPRPDYVPLKLYSKNHLIGKSSTYLQQDPPQDMDHEKVLKSRPKVVMTPAHDLDSIKEPFRKLIVDDIYLSETARSFNEKVALVNRNVVKAPFPNFYSKPNPMALKRVVEPYVSPEWRMDSVIWDAKQLRAKIDPTKKV